MGSYKTNFKKMLKMKWKVTFLLAVISLIPLFQNCQKYSKNLEMALPNDVQVVTPGLTSFDETVGVLKNYSVDVSLENREVMVNLINDSSSATAPINVNSCKYGFSMTPPQQNEFKGIVEHLLICKGMGDGDPRLCAGSCPSRKVSFETLKSKFHVNLENLGGGSLYFCGGEDKLKSFLFDLLKSNIQSNCPADYDQLFK